MDKIIASLMNLTLDQVSRIQSATYEELENFVEQRESLIQELQLQTWSDQQINQYREQVSQVLQYDPIIIGRMEMLKNEAIEGLEKASSARKQKSAYEVSYSAESMFFDKKK